jgi:hypothetical protein
MYISSLFSILLLAFSLTVILTDGKRKDGSLETREICFGEKKSRPNKVANNEREAARSETRSWTLLLTHSQWIVDSGLMRSVEKCTSAKARLPQTDHPPEHLSKGSYERGGREKRERWHVRGGDWRGGECEKRVGGGEKGECVQKGVVVIAVEEIKIFQKLPLLEPFLPIKENRSRVLIQNVEKEICAVIANIPMSL